MVIEGRDPACCADEPDFIISGHPGVMNLRDVGSGPAVACLEPLSGDVEVRAVGVVEEISPSDVLGPVVLRAPVEGSGEGGTNIANHGSSGVLGDIVGHRFSPGSEGRFIPLPCIAGGPANE